MPVLLENLFVVIMAFFSTPQRLPRSLFPHRNLRGIGRTLTKEAANQRALQQQQQQQKSGCKWVAWKQKMVCDNDEPSAASVVKVPSPPPLPEKMAAYEAVPGKSEQEQRVAEAGHGNGKNVLEKSSSSSEEDLKETVRGEQQQTLLPEKSVELPSENPGQDHHLLYEILNTKAPEIQTDRPAVSAWSSPEELDRAMQETRDLMQFKLAQRAAQRLLKDGFTSADKGSIPFSYFSSMVLNPKPMTRKADSEQQKAKHEMFM